jgi:hypothetical protein
MDTMTQEQQAVNRTAIAAVTARMGYYRNAGMCAGWGREVVTAALGPGRAWDAGPDAIGVAQVLADGGFERTADGDMPQVGDVIIWTEGHGPHGHLAIRVLANRVAENSSAHISDSGDARGFRPLALLDTNWRWFRLWE